MRYRVKATAIIEIGGAVRESLTAKSLAATWGAYIRKIEVLENCSCVNVHLQVLSDGSIRRQKQPALLQPRHRLVVVGGSFFQANFLREKEKGLVLFCVENAGNEEWPPDRSSEILPAIERSLASNCLCNSLPRGKRNRANKIEVIARVKRFVTDEVVKVSVELSGSGFGRYLHGARRCAPILGTVVRSQHFYFLDRIQTGINHERGRRTIQPDVKHVASIDFESVVLDAASIHGVLHAADYPHLRFVLPGLVSYAGSERD